MGWSICRRQFRRDNIGQGGIAGTGRPFLAFMRLLYGRGGG